MKVSSALARALVQDHDLSTMFGVLGGGNLILVDDFIQEHGGTYVKSVREEGAIQGAMGFSHASGRLGVATVSHGPGVTNSITSLVEGVRSNTPLLLIASDTGAGDRTNLQNIDQGPLVRAAGAELITVEHPDAALDDLARAIRQAFAQRRPVVLNVPSDLMDRSDIEYVTAAPIAVGTPRIGPDPASLDQALGAIANAQRPLILAGWGAVVSDARDDLVALAERLGAPVATSLKAKGLFRGDPYDLGVHGSMSSTVGGEIISRADCVVAFGASLNVYTAGHGAMLQGKSLVQVDVAPSNMSDLHPATVEVVGDAGAVARSMSDLLDRADHTPSSFRSPALAEQIAAYEPLDEIDDLSGDGTVDLRSFMVHLDRLLPQERGVVTDGGRFVVAPMRYLDAFEPRGFLAPLNFGSIGLAVGSAVGMAAARPDRPTVLVVGDGGFMMSINELSTAVRLGQDLIVVVLNDHAYGSEYHMIKQRIARPESTSLSMFEWPSFAELAEAMGAQGLTVRSLDDLELVRKSLEDRDGPLLIDVLIDPAKRVGFMD